MTRPAPAWWLLAKRPEQSCGALWMAASSGRWNGGCGCWSPLSSLSLSATLGSSIFALSCLPFIHPLFSVFACLPFRFQDTGLDSANSSLRACRFGGGAAGTVSNLFFLARAPVAKRQVSYVVAFDTLRWTEVQRQVCSPHGLCALTTSNDGRHLAVGDLEGNVVILSAIDLKVCVVKGWTAAGASALNCCSFLAVFLDQVLVRSKAHGIFVTSLAFLPRADNGRWVL